MATSSTQRSRAARERRRHGELTLRIVVSGGLADELTAAGFLAEWDAEDPAAIAAAVERVLELLQRRCSSGEVGLLGEVLK